MGLHQPLLQEHLLQQQDLALVVLRRPQEQLHRLQQQDLVLVDLQLPRRLELQLRQEGLALVDLHRRPSQESFHPPQEEHLVLLDPHRPQAHPRRRPTCYRFQNLLLPFLISKFGPKYNISKANLVPANQIKLALQVKS